ncbi:hypothetical protein ACFQZI_19975 [Mucilaginibacter lutimaris]|uniref:Uncharacterized protein n=1 Tax=Mucilaginibacter lutimaris TaxID=931629 RepID=A0ABW2ZLR0_9SPHI
MKNLKLKMSVAALLLGFGSAMATAHHAFANRKWGKDPMTGVYSDLTGVSYICNQSTRVCTEEYPADVDPNNQAGDQHPGTVQPTNIVLGDLDF